MFFSVRSKYFSSLILMEKPSSMYCLYDQNQSNSIFFSLKGKSFIQADEDDEGYFGRGQTFVVEDKYLQLFQIFLCVLMAFFTLTVMQCTSTLRNDLNNIGSPRLSGPQLTMILPVVQ